MKNIRFGVIRYFSTAPAVYSNNANNVDIPYKIQQFMHLTSIKLREEFWRKENFFEKRVRIAELNDDEKLIYELHKLACQKGQLTYIDPKTGNKASTRLKHFLRRKCCGSGCRHCPYEHENVPEDKKQLKKFNSAFYIDIDDSSGSQK